MFGDVDTPFLEGEELGLSPFAGELYAFRRINRETSRKCSILAHFDNVTTNSHNLSHPSLYLMAVTAA